jgi:hypothetical protein
MYESAHARRHIPGSGYGLAAMGKDPSETLHTPKVSLSGTLALDNLYPVSYFSYIGASSCRSLRSLPRSLETMSDLTLPSSLLSRLRSDESSLYSDLATSPLSSSISSAKTLATRKLLAATPEAIDTTLLVMRCGADKERLAAASLILAKSPATAENSSSSEASLPPALLATLSLALSSLASAFSSLVPPSASPDALRAPPDSSPATDVSVTIEEDPVKSEPLPILNLPSPSPSHELTSSGVVSKKEKPAPEPKAKAPAKKRKAK